MGTIDNDLDLLESAMRQLFQTLKRPQTWSRVTARAGVDLDRPAAIILFTLINHGARRHRLNDLAAELGIEAPSVTRKTQALEQAGYLRRLPDPVDKRAISLEVTPAGKQVAQQLRAAQREDLSAVLAGWDARDRERLVTLLERFSCQLAGSDT